jgi:hypothetical protein
MTMGSNTTFALYLETLRGKLPRVEQCAQRFDALEQVMYQDFCSAAIEAVSDLKAPLKALGQLVEQQQPGSFERLFPVVVPLFYALDRADEALLQLVAYQPVCRSVNEKRLRQRQTVARRLSELTKAAQETLTAAAAQPGSHIATSTTAARRRREHAGFSVVREDESGSDEQAEPAANSDEQHNNDNPTEGKSASCMAGPAVERSIRRQSISSKNQGKKNDDNIIC